MKVIILSNPFFQIIYLLFLTSLFISCATTQQPSQIIGPVSKIFQSDYQKVWQSTMLALENYPIETENNEQGFLKTELIPIEKIWKFPFERQSNFRDSRYRLHIYFIKSKSKSNSQKAVLVKVLKKVFVKEGFISDWKQVPSDGLEEQTILYRILRELIIDKAITHYHKKKS